MGLSHTSPSKSQGCSLAGTLPLDLVSLEACRGTLLALQNLPSELLPLVNAYLTSAAQVRRGVIKSEYTLRGELIPSQSLQAYPLKIRINQQGQIIILGYPDKLFFYERDGSPIIQRRIMKPKAPLDYNFVSSGLAIEPSTGNIFVVQQGDHQRGYVTVLSAPTGMQPLSTFEVTAAYPARDRDIVFDKEGHLMVLDVHANVSFWDPILGTRLRTFHLGGVFPKSIHLHPTTGHLILPVQKWNTTKGTSDTWIQIRDISQAGKIVHDFYVYTELGESSEFMTENIHVDQQGNIVCADIGDDQIVILSPTGKVLKQLGPSKRKKPEKCFAPRDVVLDNYGNILVIDAPPRNEDCQEYTIIVWG